MKLVKLIVLFLAVCSVTPEAFCAKWFRGLKKIKPAGNIGHISKTPVLNVRNIPSAVRAATMATSRFSASSGACERYIFHNVKPTTTKLPFVVSEYDAPWEWLQEATRRYNQLGKEFTALKKELDPVLYYQSQPSEARAIHGFETDYFRQQINAVAASLKSTKERIDIDDAFLTFVNEYITYARWMLEPQAKDLFFIEPVAPRKDRTFNADEFFLRSSQAGSHFLELASSRAKRADSQLPAGLNVAVLNDDFEVRDQIERLHRRGKLFAGGTVKGYKGAEELLRQMQEQGVKIDVIFTDIIMPNGGGGYYLASKLRNSGYNGVIIALTSYEETEELGYKMFDRGFDAMIRLKGGETFERSWPADLMEKMLTYYNLRDLNGWSR